MPTDTAGARADISAGNTAGICTVRGASNRNSPRARVLGGPCARTDQLDGLHRNLLPHGQPVCHELQVPGHRNQAHAGGAQPVYLPGDVLLYAGARLSDRPLLFRMIFILSFSSFFVEI